MCGTKQGRTNLVSAKTPMKNIVQKCGKKFTEHKSTISYQAIDLKQSKNKVWIETLYTRLTNVSELTKKIIMTIYNPNWDENGRSVEINRSIKSHKNRKKLLHFASGVEHMWADDIRISFLIRLNNACLLTACDKITWIGYLWFTAIFLILICIGERRWRRW